MRIKNLLKLICCCVCPSEESQEDKTDNNQNKLQVTSSNKNDLVYSSNNMSDSNGKSKGSLTKLFTNIEGLTNRESTMPFGNSKDIGESSGIVPTKLDDKKDNHENCDNSSINSSSPDNSEITGTFYPPLNTTDDKVNQSLTGETPGEDGGWIIV